MAVHQDSSSDARDPPEAAGVDDVRLHSTSPGRTVFTEAGNTEGWIATDHTVDVDR